VLRSILISLADGYTLRGWAQLAADGAERADFASGAELIKLLHRESWDIAWVQTPPRGMGVELLAPTWQGTGHLCAAQDAAYALGLATPADEGGFAAFAAAACGVLAALPDDLLVQCASLVREEGATARLGLFAAEVERRFDVLNVPASGAVDISHFAPPLRGGGPAPRQEVPTDLLERLFAARSALAGAFDSYEDRPQQREMVQAVEGALAANRTLVVEAGTGVGKSLAYLLPLAIHCVRTGKLGLVSTNTLNLQQQLLSNDIPRLRRILDTLDVSVTLLKGREHYLCLKRLEDTWLKDNSGAHQRRMQALDRRESALLFMLRALVQGCDGTGDLDALPAPPGLSLPERNALARGIDCGFHTCLGDKCEHKPRCHFFKTRDAAMASHITLTNHALVFSLFNPEAEDSDSVVTRASALVLDEAHNLEGAITSARGLELSNEQPVELGNELQKLLENPTLRDRLRLSPDSIADDNRDRFARLQAAVPKLSRWVLHGAEVGTQVAKLLEQAAGKGHLELTQPNQLTPATATPGQQQVLELLEKLAQRLLGSLRPYRDIALSLSSLFGNEEGGMYLNDPPFQMELQALWMRLESAVQALDGWQPSEPSSIAWFNADLSGPQPRWSYCTAPLDVGPVFQSLLAQKESTVLCSATLSVAGSFDYLQRSLGFTAERAAAAQWLKLDSPFDYRAQSLLLVGTDLASPTGGERDRYLRQLEDVVAGVCDIFHQGVLVLFNSYRDLNHIAQEIAGRVDEERLLVQGQSGSRAELADRFRLSGDKVLLATRSFWEGFDVSGEALSCVVLAKLPFANFKEPINAGRQRALDAAGRDSFRDYSLPLAAMQLKQGFGRLIRSKSDRGCVFLLDSRVSKASYGKVFLESLPGPRMYSGRYADCLSEARKFMAG
jgi:Rad3-related DNA helicase